MKSIKNLSPDERAQLLKELQEQEREEKNKVKAERNAYKDLVNEAVPVLFKELQEASNHLARAKKATFDGLKDLINMKAQVYESRQAMYSHSFTTTDGITLIVGNRILENWDDTVTAGIEKVKKYLDTLAKDENSKMLIRIVNKLLAKDEKGNLKSSRVLQLRKEAEATGNKEFIDAISIILDAYKPTMGKTFVSCRYKRQDGVIIDLPLDISAVDEEEIG